MADASDSGDFAEKVAALTKELRAKKSYCAACRSIAELCEKDLVVTESCPAVVEVLAEAGKVAFVVVQSRFSNPKFWQAGLELFLALESVVPAASKWVEAAVEEVDDEAREKAKHQKQLRKLQEERAHNKGRWSDANTPVSMTELLAAAGLVLVEEGDGRPGMSRDAQHELRVVTVLEEDLCVVCQEAMPAGSKAKSMPCGHKFHDECLLSWVKKSNSCPTCRFDDLPSEKRHFDDVQRAVQSGPVRSGLYA